MKTRSPTLYLIEKFKANGVVTISPNASVRFVRSIIEALPHDWQDIDRDALLKKIREICEQGAATGLLKRKRDKSISGYVYEIVG
jgi:hypothetical protein